jgi:alpha-amylase/alpha-mannosidase (GH57 family)
VNRFVCLHGHFYQPPRHNAWSEEIEAQWSAAPYHDWNERIEAECYAPNAAARILGAEDRIVDIVNNYASISFDAGPTLLAWLERAAPETYRAILEADKAARARFRGHGGAMAQAYNHLIMPLATSRDKRTQVLWGIRDFEARFGRKPEGLWLPETAVDLESLDIMAGQGLLFTVLAPRQAAAVRDLAAGGEWREVDGGRIDPRRSYLCRLSSGRTIALFFYDGTISHELAFGGLLRSGEDFAKRLTGAFSEKGSRPELVHIATDGESYGHHHRFGEMALAYALRHIERDRLAEVTVYGDYLERFPPAEEVRIHENTSWSCVHGLERWRSNCSCSSGAHPGWSQEWRAPLRQAMDWLGERAAEVFESGLRAYAPDPWAVRDDYIRVVLDRSGESVARFLADHAGRTLSPADRTRVLRLLELARHAMLIFTSDGWFFDDISNIETVQIVQYAARAMELVRDLGGPDLEPEFVGSLKQAKSNVRRHKNGAFVYETLVRPAMPDVLRPCGRNLGGRVREHGAEAPGALFGRSVAALLSAWSKEPEDVAALEKIEEVLAALKGTGIELDLWQSQNVFVSTVRALHAGSTPGQSQDPSADKKWLRAFRAVAGLLRFDPSAFEKQAL